MFMLMGSSKVLGAIFCVLIVGFCLLSVQACMQVIGVGLILISLFTFASAPISGTVFIVVGYAMIIGGRKWAKREDEKAAEQVEAAAGKWKKRMEPTFLMDEER